MEKEKKKYSFIFKEIPKGFKEYLKIDLLEQRETVRTLSRIEILLAGALFLLGLNLVPLSAFSQGGNTIVKIIVTIGSFFAFIAVREVVHVIIMRAFGVNEIQVDVKMGAATVSSPAYFKKNMYGFVTILPIIIMGAILITICALIQRELFWCVYPSVIANFAGSSADYYVLYLFTKTPEDSIVLDEGTSLTFYSKEKKNT